MIDRKQGRSLMRFRDELGADYSISDSMAEAVRTWGLMYTNEAEWTERGDVHSLNLAYGICREFARLVTLELKSRIDDDEELDKIYQSKVIRRLRVNVAKACARGGIVIKPRIDRRGDIQVDFVTADNFLPISFDSSGNITAALFGSHCKYGKDYYTLVERREMKYNNSEVVEISVYKSREAGTLGKRISAEKFPPCWRGTVESIVFNNLSAPLYTYFRMPFDNCVDEDSPLGVSVFDGAIELIKDADNQYSSLLWEYKGGEMAVYADTSCMEDLSEGADGETYQRLPEHTKRLVRKFESGDGNSFYETFAPQLRDDKYKAGLDCILKKIEFACQLAYGTLSDPQSVDKTAEEIKASKQRSYSAVAQIQNELGDALNDVVKVLDYYAAILSDRETAEHITAHEFDDSLACDRVQEFKERMEMTKAGYSAPWELRAWYYGETEDIAKKKIAEMDIDL